MRPPLADLCRLIVSEGPTSYGVLVDRMSCTMASARTCVQRLTSLGHVVFLPDKYTGSKPCRMFALTEDGEKVVDTLSHTDLVYLAAYVEASTQTSYERRAAVRAQELATIKRIVESRRQHRIADKDRSESEMLASAQAAKDWLLGGK